MISKEEFAAAVQGFTLVDKAVKEAAEKYLDKFGGYRERISSIDCDCYDPEDIETATIDISTEAYHCGCCGPDYEFHSIPVSYVWDPDWEAREEEKRAEAKRLREERQAAEKKEAEKKRQEQRYEEFLKMKEEFEN